MKPILMLAALAAAPCSATAFAQSPPANNVAVVRYADLDLSRQIDVRKLDRRIAIAAVRVCGTASTADPAGKNAARRCRRETIAHVAGDREQAIASRAAPALTLAVREP